MKATIDGRIVEELNFFYFQRDMERKAERDLRKQKIAELVAEGIDRQLAADMVDCGLV